MLAFNTNIIVHNISVERTVLHCLNMWHFSKHSAGWSLGALWRYCRNTLSFLLPSTFLLLCTAQSLLLLLFLYMKYGYWFNCSSSDVSWLVNSPLPTLPTDCLQSVFLVSDDDLFSVVGHSFSFYKLNVVMVKDCYPSAWTWSRNLVQLICGRCYLVAMFSWLHSMLWW